MSIPGSHAPDDDDRAFWEQAAQGWKSEWGGRLTERANFRCWGRLQRNIGLPAELMTLTGAQPQPLTRAPV